MNPQNLLVTLVFVAIVVAIVAFALRWYITRQKSGAQIDIATLRLNQHLINEDVKKFARIKSSTVVGDVVHFKVNIKGKNFLYIVDKDDQVRVDAWKD